MTLEIINGSQGHVDPCMEIAGSLRTHFDDKAMERMPGDMADQHLLVAEKGGEVVGFLTCKQKGDGVAEITWLGVWPERQRQGIGTALVDHLVDDLSLQGIELLEVKTLADTVDYPPYEVTRAFYRALGFHYLETVLEWDLENPCATYVRALHP